MDCGGVGALVALRKLPMREPHTHRHTRLQSDPLRPASLALTRMDRAVSIETR